MSVLHLAPMESRLQEHLDRRRREGTLRSLMPPTNPHQSSSIDVNCSVESIQLSSRSPGIDFASNDYLGLARCQKQHALVQSAYERLFSGNMNSRLPMLGASGSRLLSGDSHLARSLEAELADVHNRPASLLFNSGYDANLSILSSLPYSEGDSIVMDVLLVVIVVVTEEIMLFFRSDPGCD